MLHRHHRSRLGAASLTVVLGLSAACSADDADRLLLQYGFQGQEAPIRDLLIARTELIQEDLDWAAASPSWRVRTFAGIVRARAADPQAFAREKARSEDIRAIYLQSLAAHAPPQGMAGGPPDSTDRLPYPMVRPAERLPAQRVPWPVLADACSEGHVRLALLHFWSEPRLELLGPCWSASRLPEDDWLLEEGVIALGPTAIPHLQECLRESTTGTWLPHPGMAARLLAALGDRSAFPEYRRRLQVPTPPPMNGDREDGAAMLMDEESLAYMEILAATRDPAALPLLVGRFADYLLNGRDRCSNGSGSRPASRRFPDDAANRRDGEGRYHLDRMAGALAGYGQAAVPLLQAHLDPWRARLIAEQSQGYGNAFALQTLEALIGCLQAADDDARSIAALRWNIVRSGDAGQLVELRRRTGEGIAGFVEARGWFSSRTPEFAYAQERFLTPLRLLATCGDTALVPRISGWTAAVRREFAAEAARLERQRGPGTVRAQLLREQDGAMLSSDRATAMLLAADEGLLAIIRLGGPDAAAALRAAAADAPWTALAESGLLLGDGRRDELRRRLASEVPETAEAAAQVLWIAGDPAAQPALVIGAARRRGEAHRWWSTRAAELGPLPTAVAAIPEPARSDPRIGVLCAAILAEAADPAAAQQVRGILQDAADHLGRGHVLRTGFIVAAGRGLTKPDAEAGPPPLAPSSRPLLEAECLFGVGAIRRGIAANALAALGDERSIPVIAASADMGAPGGTNPVVPALESFGARGAAIAARVPRLVPAQADTGLAVVRHRYGTQVLAELGDIRAVEQILEGLQTLEEDRNLEGWAQRARVYLKAARTCTDDRLVEPLLRFAGEAEVGRVALLQLARYPDPRCEAALLAAFRAGTPKQSHQRNDLLAGDVVMALAERWGAATPQRLAALAAGDDSRMQAMALLALAELSQDGNPDRYSEVRWPAAVSVERRSAQRNRELVLPILATALASRDPLVASVAADAMPVFIGGRAERIDDLLGKRTVVEARIAGDPRGVAPLTAWLEHGGYPDYAILECLGREGDDDTGRVLMGLLGRGRPFLVQVGPHVLLDAIARRHPPGAAATLARFAVEPSGSDDDGCAYAALDALTVLGAEGVAELARLQAIVPTHRLRGHIADLLSHQGALDPLLTRRQLDACFAATADPEFTRDADAQQPWRGREAVCTTMFAALARCDGEAARLASASLLRSGSDRLRQSVMQYLAWRRLFGAE